MNLLDIVVQDAINTDLTSDSRNAAIGELLDMLDNVVILIEDEPEGDDAELRFELEAGLKDPAAVYTELLRGLQILALDERRDVPHVHLPLRLLAAPRLHLRPGARLLRPDRRLPRRRQAAAP